MDHHSTTKKSVHREDVTLVKISNLKRLLNRHLFTVREQREKHPDSPSYAITEKDVDLLHDQFQAIREEGERIDYNTFNNAMKKIDELLKKLRIPVQFRRTDILNDLNELLHGLERTIRDKAKKKSIIALPPQRRDDRRMPCFRTTGLRHSEKSPAEPL